MVIWLIGMSGAGKTTIARALTENLRTCHDNVVLVDGDVVRGILGNDLGHTIEDRERNAGRVSRMCKWLESENQIVVCAILSIFHNWQDWNRANFKEYFEVFVDVPLDTLKKHRDYRGIYAQATQGQLTNVVGVDIPFPPPKHPDLVVNNSEPRNDFTPIVNEILTGIRLKTGQPA